MAISVALCTFNGSKYVEEQIRSILNQTMPVDEIVVCDDGSMDDTLTMVEELSSETEIAIRIFRNEQQMGPSWNFNKAIELCQGDIVFLSDQDDVWCDNKVQVVIDWFDKNPHVSVVFSDAALIDEKGSLVTTCSLWDCIGFTPKARKSFDDGFGIELFAFENRATGATMAVRRDFAMSSGFVSICDDIVLHDGALSLLALERDALGYIPQLLTRYRCHGNQSVGIGAALKQPLSDDYRETSNMCNVWMARPLPDKVLQRMNHVALRYRMTRQRAGLLRIIGNTCRYRACYGNQWKSVMNYDICHWKKALTD